MKGGERMAINLDRKENIRFDGRVAVVTGAGGGLGKIYALGLALRGAKVIVNDYGGARDGFGNGSSSPADRVVEEIREMGGHAVASYDSVATPEGGEKIIKTALNSFGKIDILINNAGILRDKSFVKMEPDIWRGVVDVHLNGAYHVTQPAFLAMRENGYGRIVVTTSAAGLYGNFGQTNYSAAKMGLVGLMNSLKLEGEKYNIKINTVAPIAATRLTSDILPPDLQEKMRPEFIAPLVLYLCSDQCPVSGSIYNAGMGIYNRAAIVTGQGIMIGDGTKVPTLEDIAGRWDHISSIKNAKEYKNANDFIGDILHTFQKKEGKASEDADKAIPDVTAIFEKMPTVFRADAASGLDVAFQFSISGEGGGEWYADIREGACRVESGAYSNPSCTIRMDAGDFLNMMSGKMSAMQAFTSGKLKIEGDVMKAQLIGKLFKF